MESSALISHYDLHSKQEVQSHNWLPEAPLVVGVTAGASCPNNLIEDTLVRLFALHNTPREEVLAAALA
jgi:4-hydroxy-3-methylbut-2-enyl diphosphate reductase